MNPKASNAKIAVTQNHNHTAQLADVVVSSGACTIGVIGLAKNSGKTVALNAVIQKAQASGICVGVTSSGRDGEEYDVVTRLPKPRIFLQRGVLVATAERLAMNATASLEPLAKTNHVSVLGRLIIYKVSSPGIVEVAGGNRGRVVKSVTGLMRRLGADLIVIDGAAGRRFSSAPSLADSVILSTGAVVASTLDGVVARTARVVEILTTQEWEDSYRETFDPAKLTNEDVIALTPAANGREARHLKVKSILTCADKIMAILDEPGCTLILGGVLPGNLLRDLAVRRMARGTTVVVGDATRILATHRDVGLFKSGGGRISVFRKVPLVAVTTNPISPDGRVLDARTLLNAVAGSLRCVPVFDVVAGLARNVPCHDQGKEEKAEEGGVA